LKRNSKKLYSKIDSIPDADEANDFRGLTQDFIKNTKVILTLAKSIYSFSLDLLSSPLSTYSLLSPLLHQSNFIRAISRA
jgi:hypothetical protein